MISPESATIMEERDIWPLIGAVQQKERNVQNVGGMVILLCVVRERVIIMQLEVNQISDGGVLIGISLTMLTLWQCSPEAPAAGVFTGYSCIKRRLLLSDKSKEKKNALVSVK